MHTRDMQPEWILPYSKVRAFPSPIPLPNTHPPTDQLHIRGPRDHMFLFHKVLHAILLPPPCYRALPPYHLSHHHRHHFTILHLHNPFEPLRLHPHLWRLEPASRRSLSLHHRDALLLLHCNQQYRYRWRALAVADPDIAPVTAWVESQAGIGFNVLNGVPVCIAFPFLH